MRLEWAKCAQAYWAQIEGLDANSGDRLAVEHIRQRHRTLQQGRSLPCALLP